MSKIQAINYQNQPKLAPTQANHASAQSFGHSFLKPKAIGEYKDLTVAEREIAKACEEKIVGRGTRFVEWLAKNESEIEKQLINALFTATLAPLVIGWNPFSKQDEQTKKYMAVRQPISAVVAIAGGVLLTSPIESWFSNRAANGGIKGLDLRMTPDKSILAKQIRKEDPYYHKGRLGKWFLTKAQKGKLEKDVEARQKEIKEFFANLISEDPNKIKFADGKVNIHVKDGKPLTRAIPNITSQEQLDAYLDKHNLYRRKFSDFLKETIGLELFEDEKIKPGAWREKLDNLSAMEFLRKIGIAGDATKAKDKTGKDVIFDENHLRKVLAQARQEKATIPQVARAAGAGKIEHVKDFVEALAKESVRNGHTALGKEGHAETATLGYLFHVMKIQKDRVQVIMGGTVAEAIEIFQQPLDKFKIENFKQNANLKDFAKNIIANKAEILSKNFKAYKDYFSIGSNLIIVAATCTALNWIYPRFVETFLPSLVSKSESKPEEAKGGNK